MSKSIDKELEKILTLAMCGDATEKNRDKYKEKIKELYNKR